MPTVKTVLVPRFGPQLGSGQPRQYDIKLSVACSPGEGSEGGKKRVKGTKRKSANILKVKLPMYGRHKTVKVSQTAAVEKSQTPEGRTPEAGARRTERGARAGVSTDVFTFAESSNRREETNDKLKLRLAVLRIISRTLEENQIIRQRLSSSSQAKCVRAD